MPVNNMFLLETSDWLTEGLTALISGLTAVFGILILISFVISLFKYIKKGDIVHQHKEARINAVVESKIDNKAEGDDLELIAVITAAIAASLNTTTDKLEVKSFRRINRSNRFGR